jgi:hypothetical protein
MKYYVWNQNQEQGPYTLEELRTSVNDGTLNREQPARQEDSTEWNLLREIVNQVPQRSQQSPTQPTKTATPQGQAQAEDPKSASAVHAHLAHIRQNSCYGVLRAIIEVTFWLSLLGTIVPSFIIFVNFMTAPEGGDYAFYTIFVGSLISILLVAARQSALLLIDIADTLLHKNA